MNLLVKIYIKNMTDTIKHFEQQTSSTLVFCLLSCSSKNQVPYFILNKAVTDSNLTGLLLRKKKKRKEKNGKKKS